MREIFRRCPQVKKKLWDREFWIDGYFANTVGKHGDGGMVSRYVQEQGKEYLQLYRDEQLLPYYLEIRDDPSLKDLDSNPLSGV